MAKKLFSFSHLLGVKGKKAKLSEDDENKEHDAEGDETEQDDDDNQPASKKGNRSRAEDENDTDENAEDDDSDPDDEPNTTSKKGNKADADDPDEGADEDDDDDTQDENPDVKKGRRAERYRCSAIFGSRYAAGNADVAAQLAFNTNMSAKAAIGTLKALSNRGSRTVTLQSRMSSVEQPKIGVDAKKQSGSAGLAASMTAAYLKVKGVK